MGERRSEVSTAKPVRLVTMREALVDDDYFGVLLEGDSWRAWRVLLIAIVGEELTEAERVIFKDLTGRDREPSTALEEFWAVIGRRGGKTRAMGVLASYLASCVDYRRVLAPGERGKVPLLAASQQQAATAFSFISGIFATSPNLRDLVDDATDGTIRLKSGVDIEVRSASFRTIRSISAVAAVCDEIAFWRSDDSANPDKEILKALRPTLATTGGLLVAISSPHAKRGELYKTFKRHYGPDGHRRILVAKASSRTMNPSLPQSVVDRAYEEDPEGASAEYGAQFRGDVEVFVSREALEACVTTGVGVRAPLAHVYYQAFCDPSGGSNDSMTLAIAHGEGDRAVLDCVVERKAPFSPDSVVSEFAATLASYRTSSVRGDSYAGEWPRERFAAHGVQYEPAEMNRSEIYLSFLPLVNSRRADLLDLPRMLSQLAGLERHTSRGGRDTVDHAKGAHDDVANAVAGALAAVASLDQAPMKVSPAIMQAVRAQNRWAESARASGVDPRVYRQLFPTETSPPRTIGAMYVGRGGRRPSTATPQGGESRNDY